VKEIDPTIKKKSREQRDGEDPDSGKQSLKRGDPWGHSNSFEKSTQKGWRKRGKETGKHPQSPSFKKKR